MSLSLSEYFDLLADSHSLPELFFALERRVPEQVVYTQYVHSRSGRETISESYAAVAEKVRRLAHVLLASGISRGDRVAICSNTRPEWMIADLAILSIGAISVSIYQTLNEEEMGFILLDSGATAAFLENEEQLQKVISLSKRDIVFPIVEEKRSELRKLQLRTIVTFENTSPAENVRSFESALLEPVRGTALLPDLSRDDVASLVYTSGTTGHPKGVVQTHGNHLSNLFQSTRTELFALEGDIFLFLPLAHSFARLVGYIGFLSSTILRFGAITDQKRSTTNIPSLMSDLKAAGANVVPCVPRILEKIKAGIEERAAHRGPRGMILRLTIKNALQHYHSKGRIGSLLFSLLRPVRRKIREEIFGERFEHVISGGAKLPGSVGDFFLALECTVYQGYGLTETCVATNVNLRDRHKPGSVGPCFYGVEIKIADDGEILFRGPNITKQYWNRPQATAEAWDNEGYFHTGDLGRLDEDGFLWITGRKKELIVSSTGKKVVPAPIEEKLVATGFITQAIVIGDERPYCVAILVSNLPALARVLGLPKPPPEKIHALLQEEVQKINKGLSKHEEVKKFIVVEEEFTVENGLLTPTLKIRRGPVQERYRRELEELYRNP